VCVYEVENRDERRRLRTKVVVPSSSETDEGEVKEFIRSVA
jgi:hypothetical protein